MNLPTLIQKIYNEVSMTGLFSFEFVDENRKRITEIFFMQPPNSKSMEEVSRSSTIPTLSSNYNLDAGNGTKSLTLSGDLWFVSVGSPDNPIAREPTGLLNQIDGLNEFFKLRWMLMRYKDYTMTSESRNLIPTSVLALSPQLNKLYKKVESNVKSGIGALADKVEVIFHDYDMDDHYFCRISSLSASQSAQDYLSVSYTINAECYERYTQRTVAKTKIKKPDNEEVQALTYAISKIDFEAKLEAVEAQLGYNSPLLDSSLNMNNLLIQLEAANIKIQSAEATIFDELPDLVETGISTADDILQDITDIYVVDKDDYELGNTTLDDYVSIDILAFYNDTQKIRLILDGMQGIINSIPREEDIVFYTNADNYTISEEQFETDDERKISNVSNYIFHVLKSGESFRSLAVRYYGDAEKYINILAANDITQNDLIDSDFYGQTLKIPLQNSTTSRSPENLIYDANLTAETVQTFLQGRDLFLQDKRCVIGLNGDLRLIEGVSNTLQALSNRMGTKKGSLNLYNVNYGVINVDDGNYPFLVKISKFLDDIVYQFQSDPRVESVQMLLDTLELNGEVITVKNIVSLIGTEEVQEVQVG